MKTHLEKRKLTNPRYSLRSFARDMNIPSSHMSKILRGLQGMSKERAEMICDRLQIVGEEKIFFVDLVLASDARSKKGKLEAAKRLKLRFSDRLPTGQESFIQTTKNELVDLQLMNVPVS